MKLKIDLSNDQIDEIAMYSLRDAYRLNCNPNKFDNSDDTIPVDQEFLNAVNLVLRYYQNAKEQQEWEMEIEKRMSTEEQLNCDIFVRNQDKEIKRLQKYEKLVHYIASDYWELSHDKIKWLYTEYKNKCRKLIEEDHSRTEYINDL